MYSHESEMWGYWCFGAPVQLTDTVRSTRGMANGALGLLDSLVFDDETPDELARALAINAEGRRYEGDEIVVGVPFGVVIRISGTACDECHTKQSVFASVDARDADGATGRASLCTDCAQKYDKDFVVRVGAPCWHSCELPDVLSRISEPLVDGEGLVVVTVDGPTTRPAKPAEVKLQMCAPRPLTPVVPAHQAI